MKQPSHWFFTATAGYALFGVLFGCCFPIVATAADILTQGLQITVANVLWVQMQQPLPWIINTAPFFLGLFATFAGRRQDLLAQFSAQLEEEIADRTVELFRSIVQQHGGRIWVASQLGAGSTFSFTLPVWQEAEQALAGPVGRPVVLVGDDAPGVGRRC